MESSTNSNTANQTAPLHPEPVAPLPSKPSKARTSSIMLAGINKEALLKQKEDEQKEKQQLAEGANSPVTSSSNVTLSPTPNKKLQTRKSFKNLFGLLSLGSKKNENESTDRDSESVEANGTDSIDQSQPPLSSEEAAATATSISEVTTTDDYTDTNSASVAEVATTKKVPAALRRRSLQRVVSMKHAQNAATVKAKAVDETAAAIATHLSLDDATLPEEAWERKAKIHKRETAAESVLTGLQQAAEDGYEEVWEKKAVEKQAEEHTVKILRRLSQLDASVEVAAALVQDMDFEEDMYEEAWERKAAQNIETRNELEHDSNALSQTSEVTEQVPEESKEVLDLIPDVSAEEFNPQQMPEEEMPLKNRTAEEETSEQIEEIGAALGASIPAVIETSDGRRLSIRTLTSGAPPPPPPPPPSVATTVSSNVKVRTSQEREEFVHSVDTGNGRRLSIRAVTPGAPPPPLPPAIQSNSVCERTEEGAVHNVETGCGRRVSIRALTPGAPPPPPPPPSGFTAPNTSNSPATMLFERVLPPPCSPAPPSQPSPSQNTGSETETFNEFPTVQTSDGC